MEVCLSLEDWTGFHSTTITSLVTPLGVDQRIARRVDERKPVMTFVPGLGPEEFGPDLRYAVTGPNGELRRTFNIFHKLAHSPVVFQALASATRATLSEMKLDPVLRELAICTVTRLAGATYPYQQHIGAAQRLRTRHPHT